MVAACFVVGSDHVSGVGRTRALLLFTGLPLKPKSSLYLPRMCAAPAAAPRAVQVRTPRDVRTRCVPASAARVHRPQRSKRPRLRRAGRRGCDKTVTSSAKSRRSAHFASRTYLEHLHLEHPPK